MRNRTIRSSLWLSLTSALGFTSAGGLAEERTLVTTTDVEASLDDVWKALTTSAGLASWMAPVVEVNLRVGGTIKSNYNPQAKIGDPGTITLNILSYEPRRVLSFNFKTPPDKPDIRAAEETWTVIRLEELALNLTRVQETMIGWGQGEAADKAYAFFKWGNAYEHEKLRKRFARAEPAEGEKAPEHKEAAERDEEALRLLGTLVGGEWIYENQRGDGSVFRTRSVIEEGPGGKGLVGRGWLGDAAGMFYHGASQVWREPRGGIRFQSLSQEGAIARGGIHLADPKRVVWDWNMVSPDGKESRYRVDMVFEENDKYRFLLLEPSAGKEPKERVNVLYARVHDAPERFKKLKAN
jgi:uncharacterized protein YndB with AHSA1/START domain